MLGQGYENQAESVGSSLLSKINFWSGEWALARVSTQH